MASRLCFLLWLKDLMSCWPWWRNWSTFTMKPRRRTLNVWKACYLRQETAYMVDMAKADALDLLGETRQAFKLVDRHV